MGQTAAREPDEVHKQRQPFSVMSGRKININDARRRISEHVGLEGVTLDADPTEGTDWPEKLAHTSSGCFCRTRALLDRPMHAAYECGPRPREQAQRTFNDSTHQ